MADLPLHHRAVATFPDHAVDQSSRNASLPALRQLFNAALDINPASNN